jgi:hypothetical protein
LSILVPIDKRILAEQNQETMKSLFARLATHWPVTLLLIVTTTLAGCDGSGSSPKPKAPTAVPPPPRQAARSPEQPVSQKLAASSETRLPVGPYLQWQVAQAPAIEGKSYLTLIVNAGGDNVVELTSYDNPDHEQYPSLYLRAVTKATSVQELLNKKLAAQLYVQVEQGGNLLHNLPDQTIEFIVTAIDGKNVRGTFRGQAHDVDTGGNGPILGSFQADVETGSN